MEAFTWIGLGVVICLLLCGAAMAVIFLYGWIFGKYKLYKQSKETTEIIQELCTIVAEHKPVKLSWCDREQPWGCILVKGDYCDECPVIDMCPNKWKSWSK